MNPFGLRTNHLHHLSVPEMDVHFKREGLSGEYILVNVE